MIISVYNNDEWVRMADRLQRIADEYREDEILIGGDFNARTGDRIAAEEAEEAVIRQSKDKILNARGRLLLTLISDIRGQILNETAKGDEEGEFTCVNARGSSVIDYIM